MKLKKKAVERACLLLLGVCLLFNTGVEQNAKTRIYGRTFIKDFVFIGAN